MTHSDQSLPTELLARVCEVVDSFDAAWQAVASGATPPRIEDTLKSIPVTDQPAFLREMLAVEVECRLRLGEKPTLAEYMSRFSEVSTNSTFVQELEQLLQRWGGPAVSEVATALAEDALNATPFTGYVAPDDGASVASGSLERPTINAQGESSLDVGSQFGRYRLIRVLGEGGMGRVFLAHDQQLDRQVALKIPRLTAASGDGLKRFQREARSAALLRHPNICPIFDVGEIDEICFLTMAFIEGEPLTRHSKPDSLLPQRQVAMLVQTLALAIHEAHSQGVLHRDLKPDNIMLDSRGEPIIMDFGLARRDQPGENTLTHEGTIMGTPAYMSPEQVEGDTKSIGPQSDIYSLGVILFELLTGQRPFQGPATVLMAKILRDAPPSLSSLRPDVEPKLEWVCWKAMSKRQAERYRNGHEMADAIQQFLSGSASARSPLMIRAPVKVIEAPIEPIETYQLTPKPTPEEKPSPPGSATPGIDPLTDTNKQQIRKLLGESSLAKTLLKYVSQDQSQRTKQTLSRIIERGQLEGQQQLEAKQYAAALRTAAAMHLACGSPETLKNLVEMTEAVAHARWNPEQTAVALSVWQKMITAFPKEVSLRKQAARFASRQAAVLSEDNKLMSAVVLCRQAMQWNDSDTLRKNLAALLKRVATSAIASRQLERAQQFCDEALKITPNDDSLKQLRQRTSPK